ncbi:hypothetical protein BaRGS_00015642, partial [Batillaria attramentaria]
MNGCFFGRRKCRPSQAEKPISTICETRRTIRENEKQRNSLQFVSLQLTESAIPDCAVHLSAGLGRRRIVQAYCCQFSIRLNKSA